MKIKRIQCIKNFGIFSNFACNDSSADDFRKYNFIYGWNYSGKTTLSRLFRCLENKHVHPDFPNIQFELKTDTNTDPIITEKSIEKEYSVRVFNEDFIEENFKWYSKEHEIEPILILGKESIELETKLTELVKKKDKREEEKKKKDDELHLLERSLDNMLQERATSIRQILGITNQKSFDKNVLKEKIDDIKKEDIDAYILTEQEYNSSRSTILDQRTYQTETINIGPLKLDEHVSKVQELLGNSISTQEIIEKFIQNPELAEWVRDGMKFHENESTCQFCGGKLPSDLFERLNKHFSNEFETLVSAIEDEIKEVTTYKTQIEKIQLPDKMHLLPKYQDQYDKVYVAVKNSLDTCVGLLESLLNKLKEKKKNPFKIFTIENVENNQDSIKHELDSLNEIISKNNNDIGNLESVKESEIDKIIKHLVASFLKESKYLETEREIVKLKKEIGRLNSEIEELQKNISEVNERIKNTTAAVKEINDYLKAFFNSDELHIEISEPSGKYRILRGDEIAKNLSTGEKNIIALVYFLTRLEGGNDSDSRIVFIDDPVSSLDNNHTLGIYGLLKEKFKEYNGQLFITTHNFNFLNLLKDFRLNRNRGSQSDDETAFFLLKRISKPSREWYSILENLPTVLKKFRSEYNYLFSILHAFYEEKDKSDFELLYIMPNVARRFLENYLFMKYPDGDNYKKKCQSFFKDTDFGQRESTLKLLDEYSHEESTDHILEFPDIIELEKSVNLIMETLERKDKEHYDSLCKSLG